MHLILIAGSLCFASLPVVGRLVIGDVPPGGIVMARMTGGAIVFGLYAWRRGTLKLQRGDLPMIALCALIGKLILRLQAVAASTGACKATSVEHVVDSATAWLARQ